MTHSGDAKKLLRGGVDESAEKVMQGERRRVATPAAPARGGARRKRQEGRPAARIAEAPGACGVGGGRPGQGESGGYGPDRSERTHGLLMDARRHRTERN